MKRLRKILAWTISLTLVIAPGVPTALADPPPSQRPNIIFILVDDLGYGDLGIYGNQTIRTPHLDALARQGMRFTNFHTLSPVCGPMRTSVVTGQYPQRVGVRDNAAIAGHHRGIPGDTVLLHQVFRNAGYTTLHIGKWHIGATPESSPGPQRGVDHFVGFLRGSVTGEIYSNPTLTRTTAEGTREENFQGHLNTILTGEAIRLMRQANDQGQNFFMNLWHFAPHGPFMPPADWRSRYPDTEEGRRAALISSLDESVGRLLRALRQMGQEDNTILVFASDNGAHTRDRDGWSVPGQGRGGKDTLYEGGIRVPLFVRWPGQIAPGTQSDALVASFDFFRTLSEMAGIDTSQLFSDGRSFASILRGEPRANELARERDPLVWETRSDRYDPGSPMDFAVREGRWKLMRRRGEILLFDLQQDPEERQNLADRRPGMVQQLLGHYRRWRMETGKIRYEWSHTVNVHHIQGDLLHFANGPGRAVINDHTTLDPTITDFSLSVWVKPERYPQENTAVIAAKGKGWRLVMHRDGRVILRLFETEDVDVRLTSTTRIPLNQWSHLSFTLRFQTPLPNHNGHRNYSKTGQARLLINGQVEAEGMIDKVHSNDDKISVSALKLPFYGEMKGLSFFGMELDAREIGELVADHPEGRSLPPRPYEDFPLAPVAPEPQAKELAQGCGNRPRCAQDYLDPPPNVSREPLQNDGASVHPHHSHSHS